MRNSSSTFTWVLIWVSVFDVVLVLVLVLALALALIFRRQSDCIEARASQVEAKRLDSLIAYGLSDASQGPDKFQCCRDFDKAGSQPYGRRGERVLKRRSTVL